MIAQEDKAALRHLRYSSFAINLIRDLGPEREECERELLQAGVSVPLYHRSEWARTRSENDSWFLSVRDASGRCCCGFAVEVCRSRALPGHRLLRVERFGAALTDAAREAGVLALAEVARRSSRILRVYLEVFSKDDGIRHAVGRQVLGLGFRHSKKARCYANTVVYDLRADEEELLSSLPRSARRNIRIAERRPVTVRPISDPALAPRMEALVAETMARTGGRPQTVDWPSIIKFSVRHPSLSKIVGLFRTDGTSSDNLLAFAWGCGHTDHAQYATAASTRVLDLRAALGYAPAWELILWAKRNGGQWFDFGGVTSGHTDDPDDPLGGISDFKRYFSKEVIRVGEEWILEPHPLRAFAANTVSAGADWLSRLRSRSDSPIR